MNVEILTQEKEVLLGRTTITAKVGFEGTTPAREVIRKEVAKKAGVKTENLIIKRILTHFGGNNADIEAAVYDKLEDASAVEHKSLMAKHTKKEEPKAEEKPAAEPAKEEKKEEAPAEEKKEEEKSAEKPKAEEKPVAEEKKEEPAKEKPAEKPKAEEKPVAEEKKEEPAKEEKKEEA